MDHHPSPPWLQHLEAEHSKLDAQSFPCGVYLVATPIGNIFDITVRALHVLEHADCIAAEDTRHTRTLLQFYGLTPAIFPYHDHNWEKTLPQLIAKVHTGKRVAVVSDAGTPLISDPGFRLVERCIAENIPLFSLPGPSSVTTALTLAGLAPQPFHFFGFLPPKSAKRQAVLRSLRAYPGTLVFFESPQRLVNTLQDAFAILGSRSAVIARELTKKFEDIRRDSLENLIGSYKETPPRGEIVLLVSGTSLPEAASPDPCPVLKKHLTHFSLKEAVRLTQQETGCARSLVYKMTLELKETS